MVTARGVSYEAQKLVTTTAEDGTETTEYVAMTDEDLAALSAGDTVYLQFSNLVNPAEKLAGAYNFHASIAYYGEDGTLYQSNPGGNYGVYDFSGNPARQLISITIPKYWTGDSYTIDGAIAIGGFANVSIGGHRGVTYASGLNTGFNAPEVGNTLSDMPQITFALEPTEFYTGTLVFQDENGNAVDSSALTVTLTDTDGNAQTMNSDGTFVCVAEEYAYVVNGAGYLYTTGSVIVTEDGQTFVISLQTSSGDAWDGISATEPAADENGVYQISTGAELAWFAATVNGGSGAISGVLTADIDLADYPWTPIGTSSSASRFTGTLDGSGHAIYNLNVDMTTTYVGLFGYLYQGAVVKNLTVSGSVTSTVASGSNAYAGGLTGYAYGSSSNRVTIENVVCDVNVTVNGTRNYAGGIAAYAYYADFTNCANLGDVTTGGNYAAGIAPYVSYSTFTGCYNAGNITGVGYVSGIFSYNGTSTVTIKACYNEGTITGTSSYNGGIAGWLKGSSTVSDVYNVGTVTGGDYTESLFGIFDSAACTLERAYSLSGATDSYGEALASYKMKIADLDPDFFGGTCDGYPALLWQEDVRFHTKESGVVTAPDCENKGYTSYICGECSVSYRSDYVDALGHDWCDCEAENPECADCAYTAPSCTEEGSVARVCRREDCDAVHTDVIPANGHTADESQTVDHVYYADCVCAVCGERYVVWDDQRLNNMELPSVGISGITLSNNDYPWTWNEETQRFESGNKGVNSSTSQTTLEITLTENASVSFNYGVSSETNYDKLTITAVIGEETVTIANAISGTSESAFSYDMPAGTYTLTFSYTKDGSSASGSDIGWFSDLVIDVDDAAEIEALINAIGEVTLDSEEAITAARAAYDALTEEQKALVTNYETLTAAEDALAGLKAQAEQEAANKAAADEAISLIDAIGEVTLDSEEAITAARAAYDALTEEQKALVTNYETLTAAEAALAGLKAQAEQEAANKAAADEVISLIDAIGEVTLDSEEAITAARAAYDALTEEQKALVTNYETMTAAEAALAELKEQAEEGRQGLVWLDKGLVRRLV